MIATAAPPRDGEELHYLRDLVIDDATDAWRITLAQSVWVMDNGECRMLNRSAKRCIQSCPDGDCEAGL